jgi:hypothetical protein
MKTFKELCVGALSEKTKVAGGLGYFESFENDPKAFKAIEDFIRETKRFIKESAEFAEQEDVTVSEQKELIIDDIIAYVYKELGGK